MRPQKMQKPMQQGQMPQSGLQFPSGQPTPYDFAQAVFGGNDRLKNKPQLNFRQMMGR